MRSRARRLVKEHGPLGLIVVDYLQLMKVPGFKAENRTAEISEISRSLKSLAKELNVPVVALISAKPKSWNNARINGLLCRIYENLARLSRMLI